MITTNEQNEIIISLTPQERMNLINALDIVDFDKFNNNILKTFKTMLENSIGERLNKPFNFENEVKLLK